jgi:S1-C subfamily serine protease
MLTPNRLRLVLGFALAALAGVPVAPAQKASPDELVAAVVRVKTFINPEGQTLSNLGREREGSGVVIDGSGLVLTIGYLMVEAYAAEVTTNDGQSVAANVVGYDHVTGFGLLQASAPLKVKPMAFGKSAEIKEGDGVVVASFGGWENAAPAFVVARREFAGSWEYLLDEAIFTAPPHGAWSGAALISREGKLVGIGSLIVGDATGKSDGVPGNMFVPIDLLPPILSDLIAEGRAALPPRPWLGVTTNEIGGRLIIERVTPNGPADKAGLRRGDIIAGVAGEAPKNLTDFYRKIWAQGPAGATIPLAVERGGETRKIDIGSVNRLDNLRLKSTF